MRKRRVRPRFRGEINVTPFIDILLVLLVIFMTITPITPAGLQALVPQPPPPDHEKHEDEKTIVLSIDRNGTLRINQEEVEASHLMDRLHDIFKSRSDRTM